jgi:serine/threonine protein kinase
MFPGAWDEEGNNYRVFIEDIQREIEDAGGVEQFFEREFTDHGWDFGFALQGRNSNGSRFFTPTYMAPEQEGGSLSCVKESDQYSLAVVAAESAVNEEIKLYLTRYAVGGSNAIEVAVAAGQNEHCFNLGFKDTLEQRYPNSDTDLALKVLIKATSKEPNERFSSCTGMMYLLGKALNSKRFDLENIVKIIQNNAEDTDDIINELLELGIDIVDFKNDIVELMHQSIDLTGTN